MRAKLVSRLIVVVAVLVPVAPSSAAEGFDTVVSLPSRIALGASHLIDSQHLYVPLRNQSVLVLDHEGNTVTTIAVGDTVKSISLTTDGSTLWVTSRSAATAYDTATFAQVDQVLLTEAACPRSAVQTGSYLVWANTCNLDDPTLAIVDLSGDRTPFLSDPAVPDGDWLGDSATHPNLIIGLAAYSNVGLWTAEITGTTAELVSSARTADEEPALDPLGAGVVEVVYGNYAVPRFALFTLPELEEVGAYPTTGAAPTPYDMTFSGDGQWFAIATRFGGGVAYSLYERDGAVPVWQYTLDDVTSEGIRLNEDGSVLYAATEHDLTDELHLIDIDLANPPDPLPVLPGGINGQIRDPDDDGVELGHVDVLDSEKNYLFTDDAGAGGYYSITDLDPGSYYLIMWNGDDEAIWDYFPQWYPGAPLYRSDLATAVTVTEDQTTYGIDVTLPWLYDDMFDSVFLDDIYWLGKSGITKGCNPPDNYLFCPDDYVNRGQMAAFINRGFDLGDPGDIHFVDDDGSVFETDIERLAGAGITKGCNPPINDRFCPDALVTRGQMAAFMARSFELVDRGDTDFIDDNGSVFEADIERLAAAGITKGCNPPVNDRFCPDSYVTRGQMAAFFHRGFENVIFSTQAIDAVARADGVSGIAESGLSTSVLVPGRDL